MDNHNFGEKIKKIRVDKNYSQNHVAHELGISQKAYSKLEHDEIKMTTDYLFRLATIFEITIDDIINTKDISIFNSFKGTIAEVKPVIKNATEKITELYEKILKRDKQIARLKKIIGKLSKK